MATVPQSLLDHCSKHPLCKGCHLGTCTAPVGVGVTDPRWQQWINEIARKVSSGND